MVESILAEARRLNERVSHLLDLTRLEEGAVQPSFEWCPADDLVAEALQGLGTRTSTHSIHLDVPPDAIVWCDPRLIEQSLQNIVDNALRYTAPGGRIDIRVRVASGEWLLTVSDNGPGLPPGRENDVFRKFHRGQSEPAGTGFGLGLAICAAVARLHGGSIAAANDGGATFTMRLPQRAIEPVLEEEGE